MNKFNARKTDGYASRKEARRASELRAMEQAGLISDLREQVVFELIPKQDGERACKYIADFVYMKDGEQIVEDVKGCKKGAVYQIYTIKRKLMLYLYSIRIKEV